MQIFQDKAINDRTRIKFANDKQLINLYLTLVFQYFNEVKQLNELTLLKYSARL